MLLSGGLAITPQAYGQFDDFDSLISRYVLSVDTSGLVFFKPEELAPGEPYAMYQLYSGDTLHTLNLLRTWTDSVLHMDHYLYQEHYRQVPIEAAFYTEHAAEGYLVFANGKYTLFDPDENAEPLLDDSTALGILLDSLDGHEFAWLNQEWEDDLKADLGDSTATHYPEGLLCWALDDYNQLGHHISDFRYRLAWRFDVWSVLPSYHKQFFVDANSGEVFREKEMTHTNGPANILTQGTQTIDTRPKGNNYILWTDDNNRDIHTKKHNLIFGWNWMPEIKDDDDDWGNNAREETTAHWMATQAWDFFADPPYSRRGMDGSGGALRVLSSTAINAAYDTTKSGIDLIRFGTNYSSAYLAVIDVAGHEYMHGITAHTSGLIYEKEPGALNESFSDIFGFMVERYAEGGVTDWLYQEDADTARSLENPGLFDQPDTYKGAHWFTLSNCKPGGNNDFCGVHVNSGVQNFWFYLLAVGGAGANDNNDAYDVSGIGIDNAALIAWWNVTNILQAGSQYADARAGAIAAATLIFGSCSNEEIQTTNAWAAVGLGVSSSCTPLTTRSEFSKPSLSPNPATHEVRIHFSQPGYRKVSVYDLTGASAFVPVITHDTLTRLNISSLKTGFYLVIVKEGPRVYTLKLLKS